MTTKIYELRKYTSIEFKSGAVGVVTKVDTRGQWARVENDDHFPNKPNIDTFVDREDFEVGNCWVNEDLKPEIWINGVLLSD